MAGLGGTKGIMSEVLLWKLKKARGSQGITMMNKPYHVCRHFPLMAGAERACELPPVGATLILETYSEPLCCLCPPLPKGYRPPPPPCSHPTEGACGSTKGTHRPRTVPCASCNPVSNPDDAENGGRVMTNGVLVPALPPTC